MSRHRPVLVAGGYLGLSGQRLLPVVLDAAAAIVVLLGRRLIPLSKERTRPQIVWQTQRDNTSRGLFNLYLVLLDNPPPLLPMTMLLLLPLSVLLLLLLLSLTLLLSLPMAQLSLQLLVLLSVHPVRLVRPLICRVPQPQGGDVVSDLENDVTRAILGDGEALGVPHGKVGVSFGQHLHLLPLVIRRHRATSRRPRRCVRPRLLFLPARPRTLVAVASLEPFQHGKDARAHLDSLVITPVSECQLRQRWWRQLR